MKKKISLNASVEDTVQDLLKVNAYVGEKTPVGHLIKRNFGNRRLPLLIYQKDAEWFVEVKNEVFHQVLLLISALIFAGLTAFLIFQMNYLYASALAVMLLLILAANFQNKKREISLLNEKLHKYS